MKKFNKAQLLLPIVLGVFSLNADVYVNIDMSISAAIIGAAFLPVIVTK